MPNTREKLIELLEEASVKMDCPQMHQIADHLITNGVSFQEESHWATEQAFKNGYEKGKQDAVKWIPVTERLPPKLYTDVLVCRKSIFDDSILVGVDYAGVIDEIPKWAKDFMYPGKRVTHWMPLPEPPKGE